MNHDGLDNSDRAELERLRTLVGPSETSYEALRADRDEAVRAAREAITEAGSLRGHIVDLSVQLSRARQDQEFQQVSAELSPVGRVVYRVRRRIRTSVIPRLAAVARRAKRLVQR